MIYLIVGYPGSGKTTARELLQKILKCDGFEASDYAKKLVKNYKKENISEVQESLGANIVAKEIITDIKENDTTLVISGLRKKEEIFLFKQLFKCIVITIICSLPLMQKRHLYRQRDKDNWGKRFDSDKLLGLEDVIVNANLFINNDVNSIDLLNHKLKETILKNHDFSKY